MRLSSTISLITWCLTFIVIASIFVAKKVVMKNQIVIRYRNSYAINLVTNSEIPKIIVKYIMTFKSRHVYLHKCREIMQNYTNYSAFKRNRSVTKCSKKAKRSSTNNRCYILQDFASQDLRSKT